MFLLIRYFSQWATQYTDFVDLAVPYCGSARASPHNRILLEGTQSALYSALGTSSAGVTKRDHHTAANKTVIFSTEAREAGLRALGRMQAGLAFSGVFYRERLYETASTMGFKDLDDFLVNFWEGWALAQDPENMLVTLNTWQSADVAQQEPYNGDFEKAMQGIKAKVLLLPSKTDLFFPPEDSETEIQAMSPGVGTLDVFPSKWGHWAGGAYNSIAMKLIVS